MRKIFKLLSGLHVEGKTTYKKGDKVVSDKDLCKMFTGKFEDLGRAPDENPEKADPPSNSIAPTVEIGTPTATVTNQPPTKPVKKKKAKKEDDDWDD